MSKTSQCLGEKPWFAVIKMFVNGYVVSILANGGNTECVCVSAQIPLVNRVLFLSPTQGQSNPGTVILTNNPSGSKFAMHGGHAKANQGAHLDDDGEMIAIPPAIKHIDESHL